MKTIFGGPDSNFSARFVFAVVSILTSVVLVGCHPRQIDSEQAVFQESQHLFRNYLEGDAATARRSLKEEISLLETATVPLYVPRQATVLFLECSRLYVLERRMGNDTAADFALTKARYWNLRRYESDGNMTDKKLQELKALTPERIVELVEAADNVNTQGKGPRYARHE